MRDGGLEADSRRRLLRDCDSFKPRVLVRQDVDREEVRITRNAIPDDWTDRILREPSLGEPLGGLVAPHAVAAASSATKAATFTARCISSLPRTGGALIWRASTP